MLLIVKIINDLEHSYDVSSDMSIESLKNLISEKLHIPKNEQRLMYKGKALSDSSKLSDYSIGEGTKIHLFIKKESETISVKESNLNRELKTLAKNYVKDANEFANIFNQELRNLVNEMSLDDIERYEESRKVLKNDNRSKIN